MASISSSSLSDAPSLSEDESLHFPLPFFMDCEVSDFLFFTARSIEELGALPFPVFLDLAIDMERIENTENRENRAQTQNNISIPYLHKYRAGPVQIR